MLMSPFVLNITQRPCFTIIPCVCRIKKKEEKQMADQIFTIVVADDEEELLDDVSGMPNLSLSDLFVKASPCIYIRQACR